MLRTFSLHAIAHAARCTPNQIRDWRRQGFLTDYGERFEKGGFYSAVEAVSIAFASLLVRTGISAKSAFQGARQYDWALHGLLVGAEGMHGGEYVVTISIDPEKPDDFVSAAFRSTTCFVTSFLDQSRPLAIHIGLSTLVASTLGRLESFSERSAGRFA